MYKISGISFIIHFVLSLVLGIILIVNKTNSENMLRGISLINIILFLMVVAAIIMFLGLVKFSRFSKRKTFIFSTILFMLITVFQKLYYLFYINYYETLSVRFILEINFIGAIFCLFFSIMLLKTNKVLSRNFIKVAAIIGIIASSLNLTFIFAIIGTMLLGVFYILLGVMLLELDISKTNNSEMN